MLSREIERRENWIYCFRRHTDGGGYIPLNRQYKPPDTFAGALWSEVSANSERMPNVTRHAASLSDELAALGVVLHPTCVTARGVSAIVLGTSQNTHVCGGRRNG